MKLIHVVGARPNFMKAAPAIRAIAPYGDIQQLIVHTGQHYDVNMSDIFFAELGMPPPHFNLQVGSGSHAQQTAAIMSRFEPVVLETRPDLVVVYGDVNSTVAAALVAAKLEIPIAHVEAGLRSFDKSMPEEINRLLTDQLAELLLTPSADADENLLREGIDPEKIFLVGNVMIDTLLRLLPKAKERIPANLPSRYCLVTLHRPSNVDDIVFLREFLPALAEISRDIPVIFPVHPRTKQRIAESGLHVSASRSFQLTEPLSYLEFLGLQSNAEIVITDSGGIQEETTYLGIPCLTVRENTERPITTTLGTNVLIGRSTIRLREEVAIIIAGGGKNGSRPPLWDGHAAERIAQRISHWSGGGLPVDGSSNVAASR